MFNFVYFATYTEKDRDIGSERQWKARERERERKRTLVKQSRLYTKECDDTKAREPGGAISRDQFSSIQVRFKATRVVCTPTINTADAAASQTDPLSGGVQKSKRAKWDCSKLLLLKVSYKQEMLPISEAHIQLDPTTDISNSSPGSCDVWSSSDCTSMVSPGSQFLIECAGVCRGDKEKNGGWLPPSQIRRRTFQTTHFLALGCFFYPFQINTVKDHLLFPHQLKAQSFFQRFGSPEGELMWEVLSGVPGALYHARIPCDRRVYPVQSGGLCDSSGRHQQHREDFPTRVISLFFKHQD